MYSSILRQHVQVNIVGNIASAAILCIGIINHLEGRADKLLYKIHG